MWPYLGKTRAETAAYVVEFAKRWIEPGKSPWISADRMTATALKRCRQLAKDTGLPPPPID